MRDPGDAALAVAWAERLDAKRQTWAWAMWIMPRSRPSGWRTWAWLALAVWIMVGMAVAVATSWHSLPGVWH